MNSITKVVISVLTFITGLLAASPALAHTVGDAGSAFIYAHPVLAVAFSALSTVVALIHNPSK